MIAANSVRPAAAERETADQSLDRGGLPGRHTTGGHPCANKDARLKGTRRALIHEEIP